MNLKTIEIVKCRPNVRHLFALKIPNAETRAAIADAETARDVTRHASAAELIAEGDDA